MRVLHVFNEIKFSGAEIMYANAAPLFQQNGVEMVALATNKNLGDYLPYFDEAGIEVHHKILPYNTKNPFKLISYFNGIYKFIKNQEIEVLHIHMSGYFWFFSLVGYFAHVKIIRTVHNVFRHRKITWIKGFLERYTARKILNVIFQSIGRSVYNNELEYYKNNSVIVNNWYDNNRFYPVKTKNEKQDLREKLNIPKDSFVIISTGGCSHVKNHHDIIKSLEEVNNKLSCVYLHLGKGVTESEEIELAKSLGLSDYIRFLGNHENVREYLIAADVYLMPSRFEGLGNAALEAMACGLPSILYDVSGLKDLISDDNNGFLIKEDYLELADKIIQYARNPDLIADKGENARVYVNHHYSIKNGVKGILELYK